MGDAPATERPTQYPGEESLAMSTQRQEPGNSQLPSPFPEGWYFVASRQDILKAGVLGKTWMGENVVAWCGGDGSVCISEAYCPHLGSYLGREAGGTVRDGKLVCPFHGFEYDTTGQCVSTPFADPPKTARLRTFESQEIAGLVFAWWGIGGRPPQWTLPAESVEQAGWSNIRVRTMRFPGHPQDTTENSVDLAHLRYVYGYDSVNRIGRILVDGPYLESNFDFRSVRKVAKIATFTMDISANTRIFGLGYSFVNIREHSIGMDMRLWVLATPVDGTLIDLSLASQVKEIRNPKQWIMGLGFLPTRFRAPLMSRFVAAQQDNDVRQDKAIWSLKGYRSRPRLCRSDGEIMPFRAYCAQFYATEDEAGDPLHGVTKVVVQ